MIATRTCGKCGQVFVTSDFACPVDGQPFAFSYSSLDKTLKPDRDESTLADSRDSLEKTTVATGSDFASRRINARPGEQNIQLQSQNPQRAQKDPALDSLVGQVLDNQYEILSLIGQGGMSVVYKARHNMLRKIVAIKTMLPHLMVHPFAMQRFQQEAQAASNIVHTNVITIYNFGITPEGQPYLVMDYLEGCSLADLVAENCFLSVSRATSIFLQVASGLAHAHKKGVIHRDLKPSNIIIVKQGEQNDVVQIVDFGIAKMLPQDGEEALNLTQTGEVFGSPLYMSPEQCKGDKLDHRADIYSLGCLMYETLTGKPPLNGDNTLEVLYKHINEVPGQMSDKMHPVPAKLEAIVFKALAKSPTNRYQTMDDLENDLRAFQKLEQFSLLSVFKSRWELSQAKRLPQSKKEKAAVSAIVVALTVTSVVLLYPTVNFWNLASGPLSRAPLLLDDDRRQPNTQSDPVNAKALAIAVKQAKDFSEGKTTGEDNLTLYASLMSHGKYYSDQGNFDSAYRAFSSAINFSTKMNGAKAFPTQRAYLELANVAYNMGRWEESENAFSQFLPLLTDTRRDGAQKAYYCARLGNCYWNGEQYQTAKKWYQMAVNIWDIKGRNLAGNPNDIDTNPTPDDRFSGALTRTRLAMIYQQQLTDEKKDNTLAASEINATKQEAARLLYTALPLWRQARVENTKNEGICELQLAKAIQDYPAARESLKASSGVATNLADDDTSIESLLTRGAEALKASCGAESVYHAIALLRLANYLWAQHDFQRALNARWLACSILSQATQNTVKPNADSH